MWILHTQTKVQAHTCAYIDKHAHAYSCTHSHTCAHTLTHMHTYTHTHTHTLKIMYFTRSYDICQSKVLDLNRLPSNSHCFNINICPLNTHTTTHTHTHTHIHTHTHKHTYTHTHTHTHAHTHTHTHTHTRTRAKYARTHPGVCIIHRGLKPERPSGPMHSRPKTNTHTYTIYTP